MLSRPPLQDEFKLQFLRVTVCALWEAYNNPNQWAKDSRQLTWIHSTGAKIPALTDACDLMATLDLTAATMLACPLPQHPCRHQDAWKSIFKVTVAEPQRRVPLAKATSSLLVWVSTGLKSYFFFTQLSRTSAYKMNLIIKFLSKVMWCRAHLKPTSQSWFLLWPVHA